MLLPIFLNRVDVLTGGLQQSDLVSLAGWCLGLAGNKEILKLSLEGLSDQLAVLTHISANLAGYCEILSERSL